MKNFWIFAFLLIALVLIDASASMALVVGESNDVNQNDVNKPINLLQNSPAGQLGESNGSAANGDLMNAVDVEGPNTPTGYIGGDAFNLGFSELLKNYVDADGLVNYPKLRRFRNELNIVVEKLASVRPEVYITWSRNEKIAFWINAYNICTLKGIIDNYPIVPSKFMLLFYPANSVMHIQGLRDKKFFMIMGIQYTLDEIERDVLLGRFEEPLACFAVCYGTIASASIRSEPYIGKVVDRQLAEQAKNFFARPGAFRIDDAGGVVHISSIFKMYKWREESLIKKYGTNKLFREHTDIDRAVLNLVKDYISEPNQGFLTRRQYSVEYEKYNWQLNEQPQTNN
ncbi:MAG: DUF547 domain-containing protein [Sedimentisphaerales bacterium]